MWVPFSAVKGRWIFIFWLRCTCESSLSWCQATTWEERPICLSRHWKLSLDTWRFFFLSISVTLSDEKMDLWFRVSVGPQQSSLPRVRVSILRLAQLGGSGSCIYYPRNRVAQFYPRHWLWLIYMVLCDICIYVYTVYIPWWASLSPGSLGRSCPIKSSSGYNGILVALWNPFH
jgi:hypothetical protein